MLRQKNWHSSRVVRCVLNSGNPLLRGQSILYAPALQRLYVVEHGHEVGQRGNDVVEHGHELGGAAHLFRVLQFVDAGRMQVDQRTRSARKKWAPT